MKEFADNDEVAFADISLREAPIRKSPYNPGTGGWPTVRHFNKETGYDGLSYVKKTTDAMCTELGPGKPYLAEYIREVSGIGAEAGEAEKAPKEEAPEATKTHEEL